MCNTSSFQVSPCSQCFDEELFPRKKTAGLKWDVLLDTCPSASGVSKPVSQYLQIVSLQGVSSPPGRKGLDTTLVAMVATKMAAHRKF